MSQESIADAFNEPNLLRDSIYQGRIEALEAEVERLQRLVETVDRQRIANGEEAEKWKGRFVFVKSEYDRLVLERRVESGTV
jgi:hypothetical protein